MTINILDVPISTYNLKETSLLILKWVQQKKRKYVLTCTLNEIVANSKSKELKESFLKADLVTADGMSIVWTIKILTAKKIERVYGPDLMIAVCQLTEGKKISHYFYGSTDLVLKRLIANLKKKFPKLKISGFYSPPFRELNKSEEHKIFKEIKQRKPNIIWVGLGGSKQAFWARKASEKLHPCIMIGVGAAFDFLSGNKKQAPLWMQNGGLEWLFRLIQEPKRLWKRYLLGIPVFAFLLFKAILKTPPRWVRSNRTLLGWWRKKRRLINKNDH